MTNVVSINKEVVQTPETISAICFSNDGELDMRAVTIMGMSAKSAGAVGYFGTGLKYAIAVFLRVGVEVVIYSGSQKYEFTTEEIDFRGQKFQVIYMNGKELPFTTELGKNWNLWQAYREIYCNCLDEKGSVQLGNLVSGVTGKTLICLSGKEILDTHSSRSVFILERRPIYEDRNVQICDGGNTALFYRGIKVYGVRPSVFTYNLKKQQDLTEDRTLLHFWKARGDIMNAVLECTNKTIIREILTSPEGTYERDFNFLDTSEATATPSKEFIEVATDLVAKSGVKSNLSALEMAKRHDNKGNGQIRPVEKLTAVQEKQFEEAKELALSMGFAFTKYPIVVTDMFQSETLGLADNGTIYISLRCFDIGTNTVCSTLIEEYIHLCHGLEDNSRAMQNYLLDKLVGLGAELYKKS